MEQFRNFTGPSYSSIPAVACERTGNYFVEAAEVPGATKTDITLIQRPGTAPFSATPATIAGRARGSIQFDGNNVLDGATFAVNGTNFFQLNAAGPMTLIGTVVDDGLPVQICANAASVGQIAVCSGGNLYVLNVNTGIFAMIPNDGVNFFGARAMSFMDGYLAVLSNTPNNQQFQLSALNDMTTWVGSQVAILLGQTDQILNLSINQEYAYFMGSRRSEIWYNTGNTGFPWAIEPGAFLETGIDAKASLVKADNTEFWIGQDVNGGRVAYRASSLQAVRISDHTVETAWQSYKVTSDCWCYAMQWNGHSVIRYIFPTADKGWQYDITESAALRYPVWTEIYFTDQKGVQHAPFERSHCYAFGLHLLGSGGADGTPGVVYQMNAQTYYDCVGAPNSLSALGFPLVRDRIVRLPWNGGLRQFLDRLEIAMQVGVGADAGQGAMPQLLVRISRDGGNTWGRELSFPLGAGGKYFTRVLMNRLGSYRDGAIWLRITDPVYAAIIGAQHYIRAGGS